MASYKRTQDKPLYYCESGDPNGPLVVFLHGMAASSNYWKEVVSQLSPKNHVINIDLLGFGRSPKPKIDYTLRQHVLKIHKTIKSKSTSPPKLIVGHSMGALLALEYAKCYPYKQLKLLLVNPPFYSTTAEVRKNVMTASSLPNVLLHGPVAKVVCKSVCERNKAAAKAIARKTLPHLPTVIAEDCVCHTWRSYSKTLENVIIQNPIVPKLESVSNNTTVLVGSNDKYLIDFDARAAVLSANPRLEFEVFVGGHDLPLSQPKLLSNLIEGIMD